MNIDKETLEKLILDHSYEEIGRMFNVTGTTIINTAKKLGIQLKKRRKINPNETFNKGKILKKDKIHTCLNCGKEFIVKEGTYGKFCCNECACSYKHKIGYERILSGDESVMRPMFSLRPYKEDILKEQGGVCAICGIKQEWNGKGLVFILDHIDGYASHNYRSNLRCICPNCDSQLDTYKSKNKHGERIYYRKLR